VGSLPGPDLPHGPVRELFEQLHELHHRAGWPSLREMAKEVGCSHTTISAAFSEPRVPRWGLLELIVETLGGETARFHRLWLAASGLRESAAPPADGIPERHEPSRPPRELPADVVAFTGRAEQVAALDALLDRSVTAPALTIAAITGTAGVGKTALAVHWAHRVAERFPDGQLYLNLRGYDPDQPVGAAQALETFLRALGAASQDIPHGLPERAARYRTLLAGRRFLVLLDNVHSAEQVRGLLPGTPSCFVVVTSRDTLPALVARDGATRLGLGLLAPEEAHALLHRLVGPRVDAEPVAVDTLARRCARLPLAVRIAAELAVARPRASLAALADELGHEPARLDLLAAGDDDHTAVRAVFSWSIRHLTEPAADAFTRLGLHPGRDLDVAGLAALTGVGTAVARATVDELLRAHLLDEVDRDRLGTHDLLHAYAAEQAGRLDEPARRAALGRLLRHYLDMARAAVRLAFPAAAAAAADGHPAPAAGFGTADAAMAWLDAERANLLAVARTAIAEPGSFTVDMSAVLSPYLDARAHYRDALVLHGLARDAAHTSGDRRAEGRAGTRLGTVHRRLGDYHEAIGHYERALRIHRDDDDRAGLGVTLHQLGLAYWRIGRYGDAVTCIGKALASYEELGDEGGAGAAEYGLGIARLQLGQHAAARDHHQRALAIFRRIGDRTGEGRTHNNIGLIEHRLHRPAEARVHYDRALRIARDVGNRTGEAVALVNLGDLDAPAGDLETARDRYAEALTLSRHIGYRVGQADALRGLGVVLCRLGRVDEAVGHLRDAVALCRDLGEYETQARALLDLADVLHRTGHHDEAVAHYRTALTEATRAGDPYTQGKARTAIISLTAVDAPAGAGPG
jgi:tetratricopeptide (TPR) repeat protein